MMAGLIRSVLFGGNDIPGGALGLYGTVLGTFGVTKIASKAINGKNGKEVAEND
jgi:hypothetical protein